MKKDLTNKDAFIAFHFICGYLSGVVHSERPLAPKDIKTMMQKLYDNFGIVPPMSDVFEVKQIEEVKL